MREKTFKANGRKVVLLGMSHVARDSFYKNITKSYKRSSMVSLTEGARDSKKLTEKWSYQTIADIIGLTCQKKKIYTRRDINADMDISEFNEETIVFLQALSILLSDGLTLDNLKKRMRYVPKKTEIVDHDLMDRRNDALWAKINKYKDRADLLIPWGAAHLPDIEARLRAIGYKHVKTRYRYVANIPSVVYSALKYFKKYLAEKNAALKK